MKNFLVFLVIILLAVIAYLLFFWKDKRDGGMAGTCNEVHCKDYSGDPMSGLINFTAAKQMADAYAADSGKFYIGNGAVNTSDHDARSIWFDLETIKKFIWNMEDTICKNGCKDLNLGLRFYYAKYPDSNTIKTSSALAGVKPEFQFHHTLFVVPTYDAGTGATARHIDFDPWNPGPDKCKPLSLSDAAKQIQLDQRQQQKDQRVLMLIMGGTSGDSDEQNHGDLAPPPDSLGSFPSGGGE